MRSLLSLAFATATLAGCTVGPQFSPPKVQSPTNFAKTSGQASIMTAAPLDVAWWKEFGDPELTSLVDRYAHQNLDLKTAAERVVQVRAAIRLAQADGLPSLGFEGKYDRQRMSPTGFLSQVTPSPAATLENDEFQLGAGASWDLDFFGKVRRETEAARADADAVEHLRHGVMLAGVTDLAQIYLRLRLVEAQERIIRASIEAAARRVALVEQRQAAGAATVVEVAQADSAYSAVRQGLPDILARETALSNAIALLLAQSPGSLAAELSAGAGTQPAIPRMVATGMPSDLILRRPDVQAAMAQLHAATARTGVAVASFYPDVTIVGNVGLDSFQAGSFFNWASRIFMIGPSVSLPIFEGGRLKGMLALRESEQRGAAVAFDKAVLQGWHDVDDALSAYTHAQEAQTDSVASVAADRRMLTASQQRFDAGGTSYLDVVSAQTELLSSEDRLARTRAGSALALADLYRALGGGWQGVVSERPPARD
jgi:NodT family efflux transporter outer membrane factor (OMF) lipoprotein